MTRALAALSTLTVCLAAGCAQTPPVPDATPPVDQLPQVLAAPDTKRPPFAFAAEDEALLDGIQRGAFNFLWHEFNATGMAPDRSSKPDLVSVAGLGFQLSAFCIGAERGWVPRGEAAARALRILRAIESHPTNRHFGMFFHFIDGATGGFPSGTPEDVVSTVDSAIFFAGALTAGEYFGGEVRGIAERLYEQADWKAFMLESGVPEYERGAISLAWAPDDPAHPQGPGKFRPYAWVDSGDEHRLVTFLAVAAPDPARRVDPSVYYRLRRPLGTHGGEVMVYLPWSGAHFVNLFAHCWIDYAGYGADRPAAHGYPTRSRVDWWENSRRQTVLQRDRAVAAGAKFPSLSPDSWGLSASDCPAGYCVPGIYPDPIRPPAHRLQWDTPDYRPREDLAGGTVTPYAAVGSVLFEPGLAVSAARAMRAMTGPDGRPAVWRDPSNGAGWGLRDAYRRGEDGSVWVAADDLAIDQGPLVLLVENARTGLISRAFHRQRWVRSAVKALGWEACRGRE